MNDEEKKAIERIKISKGAKLVGNTIMVNEADIDIILNLIEKQQAEIEKLRKQKIEYQPSITITNSELLKGK